MGIAIRAPRLVLKSAWHDGYFCALCNREVSLHEVAMCTHCPRCGEPGEKKTYAPGHFHFPHVTRAFRYVRGNRYPVWAFWRWWSEREFKDTAALEAAKGAGA